MGRFFLGVILVDYDINAGGVDIVAYLVVVPSLFLVTTLAAYVPARRASIALGLAFVFLAGINVWLVREAWSRVKAANVGSRLLWRAGPHSS
ncbi:MAG TPA: hypothetical protein VH157_07440 [Bryobacteraceae bacterium]|nr:hypothetical protein [Bryobacteraceae bacterium]